MKGNLTDYTFRMIPDTAPFRYAVTKPGFNRPAYEATGAACDCLAGQREVPCKHTFVACILSRQFPAVNECLVRLHQAGPSCLRCGTTMEFLSLRFDSPDGISFDLCPSCDYRKVA